MEWFYYIGIIKAEIKPCHGKFGKFVAIHRTKVLDSPVARNSIYFPRNKSTLPVVWSEGIFRRR